MKLNYETWVVVDTKYNCLQISRQYIGETWSEKHAVNEAEYWDWNEETTGRFKALKVKISFEEIL